MTIKRDTALCSNCTGPADPRAWFWEHDGKPDSWQLGEDSMGGWKLVTLCETCVALRVLAGDPPERR